MTDTGDADRALPPRTEADRVKQRTPPLSAPSEARVEPGGVPEFERDGALRSPLRRSSVPNRLEEVIGSAPGTAAAADLDRERDAWPR